MHTENGEVTLYSRNGNDLTQPFQSGGPTPLSLPSKSAILQSDYLALKTFKR